ncbi:hypothetical protein [Argonema antarcticum]|uniref:hypothetical protein n=1 Tax=Argonema antarcticum TaxID=2942763 RepID=UPI00201233A8|nr:hypothetical protein [Argonema antarcticum]MCL1470735.1 hypothetical protein [Argonema antarcticum A004/B2]
MNETNDKRIGQIFVDGISIDRALNQAVQKAVWKHKVLGNPVAAWRDGKVVWIPPEEISISEDSSPLK